MTVKSTGPMPEHPQRPPSPMEEQSKKRVKETNKYLWKPTEEHKHHEWSMGPTGPKVPSRLRSCIPKERP